MTQKVSQRAHRRLAFTALTVASAGALVAQMTASASASAPVTVSILNDVSCTRPGNCMAVGYFQESGPGTVYFTMAEKWNGSTWTIVPSPSPQHPGGGALLTAVSCASSIRCMAVGYTLFLNAHDTGPCCTPRSVDRSPTSSAASPAPARRTAWRSAPSQATTTPPCAR
jgi:hypothetical protein